jgi:surface polysaccharide O-acyltransferase-like enzyme
MKRIEYLDTLRGLAIFFMIMQHAFLMHEIGAGDSNNIISIIFVGLGTWPAAPVFMVVLGIFLMQSKKTNKVLMFRGLKLLALGYFLNFIRFTIPLLIANDNNAFILLFEIDILQLAGLSFILLAGFRKVAQNKILFPVVMILIAFVSPYVWNNFNYLTDPFIGSSDLVSFPVFPWIIYPMLGMYLSNMLLSLNKQRIIKLLLASFTLAIIGVLTIGQHTIFDYPQHTFDLHFLVIAFVIVYFLIVDGFTRHFGYPKILSFWSQNITQIYILQWIIFGYSILFLDVNKFGPIGAMIIGLIVVIIVHFLVLKTKINKFLPKV